MWYELQREMTESGKVVRFKGPVLKPDAEQPTEEEIVRVGPYIAVSGGKYLAYDPMRGYLKELSPQLGGARAAIAARLEKATGRVREGGCRSGTWSTARAGVRATRPDPAYPER
jgi:biopolymer transport protein ExbB